MYLDVEVDISCKEVVQFLGCCLAITGFVYVDDKYNDGRMTKGIKEAFLNKTNCSKGSSEKSESNFEYCKACQLYCERIFSHSQKAVTKTNKSKDSRTDKPIRPLHEESSNKMVSKKKKQRDKLVSGSISKL